MVKSFCLAIPILTTHTTLRDSLRGPGKDNGGGCGGGGGGGDDGGVMVSWHCLVDRGKSLCIPDFNKGAPCNTRSHLSHLSKIPLCHSSSNGGGGGGGGGFVGTNSWVLQ
jgi:hypothetical protein